jgi:hypothetical protein
VLIQEFQQWLIEVLRLANQAEAVTDSGDAHKLRLDAG